LSKGVALTENNNNLPRHPLAALHDPATIRLRCAAVMQSVQSGVSPSFTLNRAALPALADRVAALTLKRFPDLRIPYHSRWRHFEAGGVDRKAELDTALAGVSNAERLRVHFDLTVVSVLLDAGAGTRWAFNEEETGQRHSRSEGLGVASFRAFMAGVFSGTAGQALRADAATLLRVDTSVLRSVFKSGSDNPMVGLEGRAALLAKLGQALQDHAGRSGLPARPGLMADRLTAGGSRTSVSAAEILRELLHTLSPIWPSGSRVQGLPAGDVWPHRWAGSAVAGGNDRITEGWVPFHKLSQWMSYSLLEPLQWAGITVTGLDALTGLPEYRNGGLLLDGGVIVPRDARLLHRAWKPGDEFIIEWRALTVVLLDELAVLVRQRLNKSAEELPLACILEGGTWAAGRELAAELREGGAPPLKIESDGTIF
jgi:Protein of unknown function (DUF1688)